MFGPIRLGTRRAQLVGSERLSQVVAASRLRNSILRNSNAIGDAVGSALEPLRHTKTILLTTYKRDGTPVGTPVSIAFNDSRASFRSWHKAWKTKRLANNPQVEAAPSTLRGESTGPAIRHEVVGMTRSASKREAVADLGATPVVADALDGEIVTRAVADAPAGPVHPAVRCARGAVRPPRGDGGGPPGASVAAEGACLRVVSATAVSRRSSTAVLFGTAVCARAVACNTSTN